MNTIPGPWRSRSSNSPCRTLREPKALPAVEQAHEPRRNRICEDAAPCLQHWGFFHIVNSSVSVINPLDMDGSTEAQDQGGKLCLTHSQRKSFWSPLWSPIGQVSVMSLPRSRLYPIPAIAGTFHFLTPIAQAFTPSGDMTLGPFPAHGFSAFGADEY